MTRALILSLLLVSCANAALRPGAGTGPSTPTPTNPVPAPDVPPTSWQPPFGWLLR